HINECAGLAFRRPDRARGEERVVGIDGDRRRQIVDRAGLGPLARGGETDQCRRDPHHSSYARSTRSRAAGDRNTPSVPTWASALASVTARSAGVPRLSMMTRYAPFTLHRPPPNAVSASAS